MTETLDGQMALNGQMAFITGASSGLGRAAALAFARAGADVALVARSETDLREVAATLEPTGRQALVLPTDLADAAAVMAAAETAVQHFGRVDVLVNNAGTDVPGPVADLSVADWDLVLNVNLRAPFLLSKTVFPHMRAAGRGTIFNISSVAGKRGWANAAAYCASKFGLTGFTQALHAEGHSHGIRAMVVYPGAMATHWGEWTPQARETSEQEAQEPDKTLDPSHVAELLVWVAASPQNLVLNEVIVTPLLEQGWP